MRGAIVVIVIILLIVVGFGGWWYGTQECKEEPPVPGLPTPGPIIDTTIGGGGNASYAVDGVTVGTQNSAGKIDSRFTMELDWMRLVDSTGNKMYGIPGDHLKIPFTDGSRVEAKPVGNELEWSCVDANGQSTKLVKGTQADGVEACMAKVVTAGQFKFVVGTSTRTGDWMHIETLQ